MPPPLTDAELAAIRERRKSFIAYRESQLEWVEDFDLLLAEVERLRAIEDERDHLQAQLWHQQELPEE